MTRLFAALSMGSLLWLGLPPLVLAGAVEDGPEEETAAARPRPRVYHVRVDSIIQPVAAEFVSDALESADGADAAVMVIELSTPGGLLDSTEEIYTAMLGAATPTVVYVSPSGARAASAGFFILMAADVAAMAPGTNTGAAHPVGGQGEDIEGAMGEKVEQDSAAKIRTLAEGSGRNVELAESAVLESRSFTAEEALASGLIDLIAVDLDELLEKIDGFEVGSAGKETKLATAGGEVVTLEMSGFQKILSVIAHPNIAYLLLTLGGLGLYFELSNPGAILPGVIGGICLILAFFALSVLPPNYAGIALILLAMIFFIAEVKVTSYGLLTVGGMISLVLGSLMLFKKSDLDPAVRVSLDVIATVAVVTLVAVAFLVTMVVRVHRQQVRTGAEGLVNERGVARGVLDPRGKVSVHGEIWHAVTAEAIAAGEEIEVVGVDGMTLTVRASPRRGTA